MRPSQAAYQAPSRLRRSLPLSPTSSSYELSALAIAEIRRTFTDLALCSYSMEVLDEMVKALMNGKMPLKQAIAKMAHSPPTTAAEEEAARAATAALGVGGAGTVGATKAVGTTRAARALSLLIALWRSAHCVQCGGQAGEPAKALAPWAAKALASPQPGGMRHAAELCGPCAAGSVGQCQTMSPPLGRQCFPYNLSTGSAGGFGGKCPHETFDCVEAALLGSTGSLPLPSAATLSARATLSGGVALPAIRRLNSLCGIGSARRLFQTVVARAPFAAAGTAENPGAAGVRRRGEWGRSEGRGRLRRVLRGYRRSSTWKLGRRRTARESVSKKPQCSWRCASPGARRVALASRDPRGRARTRTGCATLSWTLVNGVWGLPTIAALRRSEEMGGGKMTWAPGHRWEKWKLQNTKHKTHE